ncbi:acetylcholinesterase-like, partial [Chrysoperla carnea]|uniref:acetylcholinesterase-like n=1 Tax=Chrysoperla carnea TaxID=189513 RepID=UPI001D08DBBF
MVWIHGGKFHQGSSSCELFGPEFLVAKDVVLVTLNYRLGYFGFLKLNDPEAGAPGNAGLKDQVQALRWVKHNIEFFCGDKNNITIFGSSAGGASVHLMTLSPLTKGLFHKAIIQSGVGLCPWAFQIRKDYELARAFGCKSNDDKQILKFLQQIKPQRFIQQEHAIFPVSQRMVAEICTATPTVEQPPLLGSFISKKPECQMATGNFHHVPIMIGVNRNEGLSFLNAKFFQKISPQFIDNTLLIPRDLRNMLRTDQQVKEFSD